jgi:type II secretory pathway component GspD/PulD (secretin)
MTKRFVRTQSITAALTLALLLAVALLGIVPSVLIADDAKKTDTVIATTTGTLTVASDASDAKEPKGLRFNFRGVPLDMVLDYLSKAAGFVIVREMTVAGNVDAWSDRPLSETEAVDLLNTVLTQKGAAAIRKGRTLTIVSREEARKRGIPVRTGNDPKQIPDTDEMVTQIIPVRYADVDQLIKNLEPLLPATASLTSNTGSNALVLTDTQSNIRHVTEIIEALDTSISTISQIRVFPLQYADATDIAKSITSIFAQTTTEQNNGNQRFRNFFRGGPPDMGNQDQSDSSSSSAAKQAQTLVVAVADDRTNSVIVRASEELMPTIKTLVAEIDKVNEDETIVRVFPLQYCDATETSELITNLFTSSSSSSSNNNNNNRPQWGFGPPGMMGGGGGGQNSSSSNRVVTDDTVTVTADTRTNSVVVRTSSTTMAQVAEMIEKIDKDPARKKKVFVYSLKNANVEDVQDALDNLFGDGSSSSNGTSSNNTNSGTNNSNSSNSNSSRSQSSSQGFGSLQ